VTYLVVGGALLAGLLIGGTVGGLIVALVIGGARGPR
jgi:hypothetical protein